MPCDAAIADFICQFFFFFQLFLSLFPRQGQCSRRVEWSRDNRAAARRQEALFLSLSSLHPSVDGGGYGEKVDSSGSSMLCQMVLVFCSLKWDDPMT